MRMMKLRKRYAEEDNMFVIDMRQEGGVQDVVVRRMGQNILMMRSVVYMVAILKEGGTRVMMMTTIEMFEEIRDRGTIFDAEGIFVE